MSDLSPQTLHSTDSHTGDIPGRLDFGSICAEYGCTTVHPAEDHARYVARYSPDHDTFGPACARCGVNFYQHSFAECYEFERPFNGLTCSCDRAFGVRLLHFYSPPICPASRI